MAQLYWFKRIISISYWIDLIWYDCKLVDTPFKFNINLGNQNCESQVPNQKLIGGFMYLSVLTWPNRAYSISLLSLFNILINKFALTQNEFWKILRNQNILGLNMPKMVIRRPCWCRLGKQYNW